jgi:uncharacterized protein YejL (UPF0352 family)
MDKYHLIYLILVMAKRRDTKTLRLLVTYLQDQAVIATSIQNSIRERIASSFLMSFITTCRESWHGKPYLESDCRMDLLN